MFSGAMQQNLPPVPCMNPSVSPFAYSRCRAQARTTGLIRKHQWATCWLCEKPKSHPHTQAQAPLRLGSAHQTIAQRMNRTAHHLRQKLLNNSSSLSSTGFLDGAGLRVCMCLGWVVHRSCHVMCLRSQARTFASQPVKRCRACDCDNHSNLVTFR